LSSSDTSFAFEDAKQRGLWRAVFTAMGSPCELLCETEDPRLAKRLADFARNEARRVDRKFSRYQPGSVVNAIHARHGKRFHVDDETARLLDFGAALWRLSDGAFDLTSGVLRFAWSFDEGRVRADPSRVPELLKRIGWGRVGWQPADIILPEGMEIDFGGIGKEYAVDRVADWASAQSNCPVLVNFGGDLRCVGPPPASGAWQVGIESIETFGKATKRIELQSGALATSGDARRHIEIEGKRYGHIFDARTGWPVANAPRSITVAAPTCSQAGSYSTLAMLQGEGAEAFLDAEGARYWCLR
jgi:thiamine biosynthesis lipoprotein